MKRREFVTLLGGTAVAWPLAAHPQERMRRIGLLIASSDNLETTARLSALRDGLRRLGWIDGRNIQIETRLASGDFALMRQQAAELVALNPDVLFAAPSSAMGVMRDATSTLPIIFAQLADPVGAGYVASLARPGGNATGFSQFEYAIAVKWLELLKQIAPGVTRAAVLYDPDNAGSLGYLRVIEPDAPKFNLRLAMAPARDAAEISRAIEGFVQEPSGGLIVLPSSVAGAHQEHIIAMAARHRLPAIYPFGYFPRRGGLASYGTDTIDLYRRAASYIDRILKGEKPADLPVQLTDKFELVINLKTAKTLGLELPITLLARTDEVIE